MEVPAAIDRNIYAMSARERKEAGIDDLPGTLNEADWILETRQNRSI